MAYFIPLIKRILIIGGVFPGTDIHRDDLVSASDTLSSVQFLLTNMTRYKRHEVQKKYD